MQGVDAVGYSRPFRNQDWDWEICDPALPQLEGPSF